MLQAPTVQGFGARSWGPWNPGQSLTQKLLHKASVRYSEHRLNVGAQALYNLADSETIMCRTKDVIRGELPVGTKHSDVSVALLILFYLPVSVWQQVEDGT